MLISPTAYSLPTTTRFTPPTSQIQDAFSPISQAQRNGGTPSPNLEGLSRLVTRAQKKLGSLVQGILNPELKLIEEGTRLIALTKENTSIYNNVRHRVIFDLRLNPSHVRFDLGQKGEQLLVKYLQEDTRFQEILNDPVLQRERRGQLSKKLRGLHKQFTNPLTASDTDYY